MTSFPHSLTNSTQDLVLYGHPDSGHACKVALALALAGLKPRKVQVDIWSPPAHRPVEFLAASPFAEVPLLMIDGVGFVQSGAILLEVATRFRCLGGESAEGLKRGRELLLWEANRIGMCLPQLVSHQRGHDTFAPDAVAWIRARYAVDRDRFDRWLNGAAFFHGATPGIGDCAIWGYVQWVRDAGVEPTAAMAGWIDRMRQLPQMREPKDWFVER